VRAILGSIILGILLTSPAAPGGRAGGRQVRFGIVVAQKGLWGEARFRFERAVALDPKNAAAYNNLAVSCEQQGDFARAREAYGEALRLDPKNHLVQQNFDLFREADDKRNRRTKKEKTPAP
jgi:Flp pilus assembly protein TadD